MDIASNIDRARVLANKTQDEMANILGISQQVYSNLIKGRTKKIDPEYIEIVKEQLGINVLQQIVSVEPKDQTGNLPQDILRRAREAKGFTQTEMGERIGLGLRMYQKVEDGNFPKFKSEQVKKLDSILGTSLYELIYEQANNTFQEPKPYGYASTQPTQVEKLSNSVCTLSDTVHTLSDTLKANAVSFETMINTNAKLSDRVLQQGNDTNSDELKMLGALRVFLHKHVIDKGLMTPSEVVRELDMLIAAHGKVVSAAYSFAV